MRGRHDAMESLHVFSLLVQNGLRVEKSLEKVIHKDKWEEFNFAGLEFRVSQLTVEVHAHSSDRNGHLNVRVWNFNKPSSDACMFDMGADVNHVARIVADYINEYEVAA